MKHSALIFLALTCNSFAGYLDQIIKVDFTTVRQCDHRYVEINGYLLDGRVLVFTKFLEGPAKGATHCIMRTYYGKYDEYEEIETIRDSHDGIYQALDQKYSELP
jgi:hypothetical protein